MTRPGKVACWFAVGALTSACFSTWEWNRVDVRRCQVCASIVAGQVTLLCSWQLGKGGGKRTLLQLGKLWSI